METRECTEVVVEEECITEATIKEVKEELQDTTKTEEDINNKTWECKVKICLNQTLCHKLQVWLKLQLWLCQVPQEECQVLHHR
jgi:hypothetical protein